MFKGKVEVVKDAEKRKPGRPPQNKIPEEIKVKRPVGRPPKEKKQLDGEIEEKLNEMMAEYLNLDDLAGLVKGVEEGLEGDAKIEPKDKKIRKILENLSTGIHQLYSAIGKKQDDEHVPRPLPTLKEMSATQTVRHRTMHLLRRMLPLARRRSN